MAERLLAEISLQGIDLVLLDVPLTPVSGAKGFTHLLGECAVSVFSAPELAAVYRPGIPRSLSGARFELPTGNTAPRRSRDRWFDTEGIRSRTQAEIEDSAPIRSKLMIRTSPVTEKLTKTRHG